VNARLEEDISDGVVDRRDRRREREGEHEFDKCNCIARTLTFRRGDREWDDTTTGRNQRGKTQHRHKAERETMADTYGHGSE